MQHLFLHRSALRHLFVHHFERHKVHGKRHIRVIIDARVKIEQSIVRIKTAEQEFHSKLLRTDVLNPALIALVNALHNEFHQDRRLTAQFLEIDVRAIRRQTSSRRRKEILHLNVELLRFGSILHIKGIERAIFANHR